MVRRYPEGRRTGRILDAKDFSGVFFKRNPKGDPCLRVQKENTSPGNTKKVTINAAECKVWLIGLRDRSA